MKRYGECPETPNEETGNVTCDNAGFCHYGQPCNQQVGYVCDWCHEDCDSVTNVTFGEVCIKCIEEDLSIERKC